MSDSCSAGRELVLDTSVCLRVVRSSEQCGKRSLTPEVIPGLTADDGGKSRRLALSSHSESALGAPAVTIQGWSRWIDLHLIMSRMELAEGAATVREKANATEQPHVFPGGG